MEAQPGADLVERSRQGCREGILDGPAEVLFEMIGILASDAISAIVGALRALGELEDIIRRKRRA